MQLTVNAEDSQTSTRAWRSPTWALRRVTPVALTWVSTSRQLQTSSTELSAEEVRKVWIKENQGMNKRMTAMWFSGKVLVHCHVGVSRSATLVLAYLMLKQHLTLVEAICAVKENRGVTPNRGFLRQLIKLDCQLFGKHWTLCAAFLVTCHDFQTAIHFEMPIACKEIKVKKHNSLFSSTCKVYLLKYLWSICISVFCYFNLPIPLYLETGIVLISYSNQVVHERQSNAFWNVFFLSSEITGSIKIRQTLYLFRPNHWVGFIQLTIYCDLLFNFCIVLCIF